MTPRFATADTPATPLHVIAKPDLESWLESQPEPVASWVRACGFTGASGTALPIPDPSGGVALAVIGYGTATTRARVRFTLAAGMTRLPAGTYKIVSGLPDDKVEQEALGWLLAGYRFDRYKSSESKTRNLVSPAGVDASRIEAITAGECLTRDLINTPANDMGPDALEEAARTLAAHHGAGVTVIAGDALLDQGFPMIHTVGRASDRAPRLIDMTWGNSGPQLVLVGKGVCFDTGGLDLKPASSMGLMKKDMGGAATVLGLAHMIMAMQLPIRLRVLVPTVENAVAGNAFRPQDVLTSRKGLTVEVNNTDAEGRLVLADALALADETPADLIVSMATLTGAARVAVGPDIAPFYCDSDKDATALALAGSRAGDPVWRMPFHTPYETMIEPAIADLDNAPSGGFAGSITAALFLRRFVTDTPRYMHFDIYGWQPTAAPARPKGGVGQGARALLDALPELLGL